MTRSDRYLDAVRALDTWRYEQRAAAAVPDLFTVPTTQAPDAWKIGALTAIKAAALSRSELTVECVDFEPAVDNRARGWAMQEAARRGWIKGLGWVSGNAGRHGRPVRLWSSRICAPGVPTDAA